MRRAALPAGVDALAWQRRSRPAPSSCIQFATHVQCMPIPRDSLQSCDPCSPPRPPRCQGGPQPPSLPPALDPSPVIAWIQLGCPQRCWRWPRRRRGAAASRLRASSSRLARAPSSSRLASCIQHAFLRTPSSRCSFRLVRWTEEFACCVCASPRRLARGTVTNAASTHRGPPFPSTAACMARGSPHNWAQLRSCATRGGCL